MALDRKLEIGLVHAHPVIFDTDQALPAAGGADDDPVGAGIDVVGIVYLMLIRRENV